MDISFKKILRTISRLTIGLVFLFSGFVKAVDPLGSKYKLDDYFMAFGLEWLVPLSLVLSIVMSTIEFSIGFFLISNLYTRIASIFSMLLMLFFTVLTFILALTNPVTDCGCFGEALKLTNWQTFYKNLILIFPAIHIFIERKKFISRTNKTTTVIISLSTVLTITYISVYSLNNLPLIDYRPYRVGQNIELNAIEQPQGAPRAQFATTLVYEKDGAQQIFTLDNLPDSTWNWVETVNKEIGGGYTPPAQNFIVTDRDGTNFTNILLNKNTLVLITNVLNLNNLTEVQINRYQQIATQLQANGLYFAMLTSSDLHSINSFQSTYSPQFDILSIDPIVLKTIVRSEGGFLLTYKGTILQKWSHDNFIDIKQLSEYQLIKESQKTGKSSPAIETALYITLFLFIALFIELFSVNLSKQH